MATYHVIPLEDSEDHCWREECRCGPRLEVLENGDLMFVHDSFDGRVIVEKATEGLGIEKSENTLWAVFEI